MSKFLRRAALIIVVLVFVILEWRPWHSAVKKQPADTQQNTAVSLDSTPAKNKSDLQSPVEKTSGNESGPLDSGQPAGSGQVIRAQLSPLHFTTITAEISAKVEVVAFREGESFKDGQNLVIFDCGVQLAQLDKVKASMGIAERNYSSSKKLLALGSVSRIETENAYSEYLKTRAEVSELSAIVSKCKIAAPFNGRVVEQRVRAQQFVQSGQPLLDILDSSILELEFVAPSKWSTWIKVGYQFKINIDESEKFYPARVTRISPRIDPVSQTIKIAAVIDGDFSELTPGMSGTISIDPPLAPQ